MAMMARNMARLESFMALVALTEVGLFRTTLAIAKLGLPAWSYHLEGVIGDHHFIVVIIVIVIVLVIVMVIVLTMIIFSNVSTLKKLTQKIPKWLVTTIFLKLATFVCV